MTFPTRQEIAQTRDTNARKARAAALRTEIREIESELARKRAELAKMEPDGVREYMREALTSVAIHHRSGICGKCHQHIGRGVKWHERACKGTVQ